MPTRLDRLIPAARARLYAGLLVASYAIGWCWIGLSLRHGLDTGGSPFGADFIIYYGASHLALAGKAASAYVGGTLLAAERTAVPATRHLFLWCYPPTFQLLIWPLGLLPYFVALAAWTTAGLAAYLALIRRISGDRWAWLAALAFPGVLMNAIQGQNGFITAALFGGGLLLLDQRPWLAGALLGALAIKPQFGVLAPLLLISTGRWKATAAAASSAFVLVLVATAAFGVESWTGFQHAATAASRALTSGRLPLSKDPSTFAALLLLHAPASLAIVAHGFLAVVATGLTVIAWRRAGPLEIKAGLAVIATLIVLPYAFDYDLVMLAIPIGVALNTLLERPAPPWILCGLILLSVTPILIDPVTDMLGVPIGPLALWWGFLALGSLLRTYQGREGGRAREPGSVTLCSAIESQA